MYRAEKRRNSLLPVQIGKQIKSLRKTHRWKQKELADKIGVDRTSLSSYENNKRIPDIYMLWRLADIFSVSLDELVGRKINLGETEIETEEKSEK